MRQRAGLHQVFHGQHLAPPGVFQRQHAGAGIVRIVWFDGGFDVGQRNAAVRLLQERLGLHAAQHSGPASLPTVGVGHLSHNKFVAPVTVGHNAAQVALRPGRHEERRLEAQQIRYFVLQGIDAGILGKHIVTHLGLHHGVAHGAGGPCDGVAAQVHAARGR